jgi:hypothetical protein
MYDNYDAAAADDDYINNYDDFYSGKDVNLPL